VISTKQFQRYASDPAAFRADLTVDVDGVARRFGDVMDPWQAADFALLDPALAICNGRNANVGGPVLDVRMRAFLERGRGHSKTTDLAVMACWALAFSTRPLKGYAYAADRDQARLLRDAAATIVRLNPWLGMILDVGPGKIVNKAVDHPGEGGILTIEASDVGSSYGILPDLIIADELVHWEEKAGEGLWHSLISSAAKRSNCLLVVISNAGFVDSWQWNAREVARTDEAWLFSRLDGPQASWLSPERLAEQRRMLPRIAYARLWDNQWSSSGGDALTPDDINAAFLDGLNPMTGNESGWLFVAGVDLGLTRDFSAVVVLGVPSGGGAGKIRLAHHKVWRPQGAKIDLMEIELYLLGLDQRFGLEFCASDPWQAELLLQRLDADAGHRSRNHRRIYGSQPWTREIPPTATNLREIATLTIECFQDHRLHCYECEPLKRDLLKLRVEERQSGQTFRLTSPRDGEGHGDCFSAFANALLIAHEIAGKRPNIVRSLTGGGSSDETPLQRALRQLDAERAAYQEEMQFLHEQGADYSGHAQWSQAMENFERL